MINKNIIEKLSTQELDLYIKPGSRYVSEAIEIAFDVLKKRGREFSDSESDRVLDLIDKRKQEELNQEKENNEFINDPFYERNITFDTNAIALYPLYWIVIGSLILTCIFGSILLFVNFIKLKNYLAALLVISFGFAYSYYQLDIVDFFYKNDIKGTGRYSASPELLSALIGSLVLFIFWSISFPKDLNYRKATLFLPIILIIILSFGIYLNYLGVEIMPFQILRYLR